MISQDNRFFRIVIFVLVPMAVCILSLYITKDLWLPILILPGLEPITTLLLLIITSILSIFTYSRFFSSNAPIAHNVAIVGFPNSGKTTLITVLFGEIFAHRIKNINATLRTSTTINRVNEYLSKMQKGMSVGPTKDQDIFAYRTNIKVRSNILSQSYKVEFGDFPGEDSEEYIQNYGSWLHTTPFFQWMASAEVVIFVIDIGKYLNPIIRTSYIADMSSAIRAAWQHIISSAEEGADAAKNRQVILAFTKSDLFGLDLSVPVDELIKKILILGFNEQIPPISEINLEAFMNGKEQVMGDFNDLIKFLKSETKSFTTIFTSSYATLDGQRVGASELLSSTLPHRNFFL